MTANDQIPTPRPSGDYWVRPLGCPLEEKARWNADTQSWTVKGLENIRVIDAYFGWIGLPATTSEGD
jgi:hypothetical protein